MPRAKRSLRAFALYEVLLGVTVFVLGVLALGRSVQNGLNASSLSANSVAVIPVASALKDPSKSLP